METPDNGAILIVDSDPSIREALSSLLSDAGCRVVAASAGEEALSLLSGEPFAATLVEIRRPGTGGIDILGEIKRLRPDTEVIVLTGDASFDTALWAIRNGAYDCIQKPFEDIDAVWAVVRRAIEKRELLLRNRSLLQDLEASNRGLTAAVHRQNSLINAGRAMSGISSLNDLLDYFVGVVAEELRVERASLMLLDGDGNELRIVASRGLAEEMVRKIQVKVGEGIAGWVAREGKPILVKDVHSDPRVTRVLESSDSESFISAPIVLSIPILIQEQVLGVINVTKRVTGETFNEEDMAFLYGLAGQAAVAIERARQFEELEQAFASLKAAQKTAVDAERLKALGQMAAGVAHDFNNLLTGFLGHVQLLEQKLEAPAPSLSSMRSHVEILERLAMQGAETVRRIQEFSRIRKDLCHEPVDVNAVVRNVVDITRIKWKDECEKNGIRIEVRLDLGPVPITSGSVDELGQALNNLLFNAVEAMPKGGTIVFRTRQEGDRIRLEVSDDGVGMSRETRERIFEPFFTTKPKGHGLGMGIVFGIVTRHHGEIALDSAEGNGTTVAILLPVVTPAEKETAAGRPGIPSKRAERRNVLIVDDSDVNRDLFEGYLEPLGVRTLTAGSGREALSILEKEPVDLVVTDLSMPQMSGWQVAERAKALRPGLPVGLVSGWAVQQEEAQVKNSGIDFVLQKPCTMRQFQDAVVKALAGVAAAGR